MRAAIVVVTFTLFLTGCGSIGITSETPLFDAADEVGAPRLHDGLWMLDRSNCRFNTSRPVKRWPKCADWQLIRVNELLEYAPVPYTTSGEWKWTADPYILARGSPRLLQMWGERQPAGDARMRLPAPVAYTALEPLSLDSSGHITSYAIWPILCEPLGDLSFDFKGEADRLWRLRHKDAKPPEQSQTEQPKQPMYSGFAEGDGVSCTTSSGQAIRDAAAAELAEIAVLTEKATKEMASESYLAEAKAAGLSEAQARRYVKRSERESRTHPMRWIRDLQPKDFAKP